MQNVDDTTILAPGTVLVKTGGYSVPSYHKIIELHSVETYTVMSMGAKVGNRKAKAVYTKAQRIVYVLETLADGEAHDGLREVTSLGKYGWRVHRAPVAN